MAEKLKHILELTSRVLAEYASNESSAVYEGTFDAGPAILVSLLADQKPEYENEAGKNVLAKWLNELELTCSIGSFGGLGAVFTGLNIASTYYPQLTDLKKQSEVSLRHGINTIQASNKISWHDYDLISGPSGAILSLCTAGSDSNPDYVLPSSLYLSNLCSNDNLESLRIMSYEEDELRSWNYGKINTGLAHGVTGIAAALNKVARLHCNGEEQIIKRAIKHLCYWLMEESFIDELGLLTWSHGAIEKGPKPNKASTRQAWCYGTPGIAWTLYESSLVLNDFAMKEFAENAMRSYCNLFHEQLYLDKEPLDSNLGICHGAAGVLAIADSFEKFAGLTEATVLCNRLENYLLERTNEIIALSGENMTLLTGGSGVLSALIARNGGKRDWLVQLGLS